MKKTFFTFLLITCSIFLVGQNNAIKNSKLKLAKKKSDTLIASIVGQKVFSENIKWDSNNSFVTCYTKTKKDTFLFSEKFRFKPNYYSIAYHIVKDTDTLYSFNMVSDSSIYFTFNDKNNLFHKLKGNTMLIENKFTITKQEAIEIGNKIGVGEGEVGAIITSDVENLFPHKSSFYFWEVTIDKCYGCKLIHIDPMSGKILGVYYSYAVPERR